MTITSDISGAHAPHRRRLRRHPVAVFLILALAFVCLFQDAQAQSGSPIAVGDNLFVDVYRRPELSCTATVDQQGNIEIPFVGDINVAGASETEAAQRISEGLKRILKSPRVTVSRGAPRMIATAPRTADMKTQVMALNNASAKVMAEQLQTMSSSGGSISFDEGTNSLIITDTPVTIQNIMNAVGQIDQMPSQMTQVRIETKVAEVVQGAMKELGIRWFVKGDEATGGFYSPMSQLVNGLNADPMANERVGGEGSSGLGNNLGRRYVDEPQFDRRLNVPVQVPLEGQLFFGLLNEHIDLGAFLDALVRDKKAELLATPNILAVNHTPAEIKMTDEFPYTESTQSFGSTQFSVKFMDLGIKMLVTPHVYRDEKGPYVKMELKPEVSFSTGMSNGVPVRAVRSSDSTAIVRDSQTLVIGGIVLNDEQNVDQRVPGLGRIPLVGNLFKHKEKQRSRNELMVFVTPTIHAAPESVTWDRMISLTGAAKDELPTVPSGNAQTEARKE